MFESYKESVCSRCTRKRKIRSFNKEPWCYEQCYIKEKITYDKKEIEEKLKSKGLLDEWKEKW